MPKLIGVILIALFFAHALPARAQAAAISVDEHLTAASRSIIDGHVKDGLEGLKTLLGQIDPARDRDAYWRIATTLIEFLNQTENYAEAGKIIDALVTTKIWESQAAYRSSMQFYVGRNLAYTGQANEGEKFLRALTAGDARLVLSPAQRAAAVMLSKIELDRDNISQAAIWIRRAVVGTMVDKGAASEEAVDVLTEYAYFLTRTRRLPEAYNLFSHLAPIYDSSFGHHGPKYLHFLSLFVATVATIGNFPHAEAIQKRLSEGVGSVDVVANSVREELSYQELYQLARTPPSQGKSPVTDRLKEIVSNNPDILKQPHNRIISSYLTLLGGNVEQAERYYLSDTTSPQDPQFRAYDIILKAFFSAARHNNFGESIALANEALSAIHHFHEPFENESSSRLPALTIEERLMLSVVLGIDASPHNTSTLTFDQANILFKLGQFINRDKGKLGLQERIGRQELKSDLQREDMRTRDRLTDVREAIMDEAIATLLSRVLPIKNYVTGQKYDYAFLMRLEDIEDKISTANEQLKQSIPEYSKLIEDRETALDAVQKIISSNEALVLHVVVVGMGLVTTCITSDSAAFNVKKLDVAERQQFTIDQKLLNNAVHDTNQPWPSDSSYFPALNAYRLYQTLVWRGRDLSKK